MQILSTYFNYGKVSRRCKNHMVNAAIITIPFSNEAKLFQIDSS